MRPCSMVCAGLVAALSGPLGASSLGVRQALEEALRSNPALQAQQQAALATEGEAYQVLTPYDPRFSLSGTHSLVDQPQSIAIFPSTSTQDAASASLSSSLPFGTRLRAELGYGYSETPTQAPSPFSNPFNPQYSNGLSLGVTQNLLKDFVHLPGLATVRGGLAMVDAARARALAAAEQTAAQVLRAYSAWQLADESAAIQRRSLEEARSFFQSSRQKYGSGLQERSELLQAESTLRAREAEDLDAQDRLRGAAERMWLVLGRQGAPGEGAAPAEAISLPAGLPEDEAAAWALAQERRPDLRAARLDLASAQAFEAVAKSDSLWDLSLSYSYRAPSLEGSASDSFNAALGGKHPNHSVGLVLSVPLLNYGGGGKLGTAQARLASATAGLRGLEDAVRQELGTALRDRRRVAAKLGLATERVRLERAKLASIEQQYRQGRVSGRERLLNQDDLLRAELGLAAARQEAVLADLSLYSATGGLLQALGLQAPAPRQPFKERILRILP
jgi:outer membrane protein TolC